MCVPIFTRFAINKRTYFNTSFITLIDNIVACEQIVWICHRFELQVVTGRVLESKKGK